MSKKIYGVSLDEKITPVKVRNAIVKCFYEAHCFDSEVQSDDKEVNVEYCREIVQKAFADAGSNFGKPTKEGIVKAMNNLAEFSNKFRGPKIIKRHYDEILELVKKLK